MAGRGWAELRELLGAALRSSPPPVLRRTRPRRAGTVRVAYEPFPDEHPDPGEVVWAWVPYEDDPARGKDRPVLVVAREEGAGPGALLALPLTSCDHDVDAEQEARAGRRWIDVGRGGWDPRGRPSEARLDRVLRLDARAVRRTGAALDRARFDAVAARLRELHGWR